MTVRDRVLSCLSHAYGKNANSFKDTDHFEYDLCGDSIDSFDVHFRLEREFGIKIPDEVAEQFYTVGEVVSAIEKIVEKPVDQLA